MDTNQNLNSFENNGAAVPGNVNNASVPNISSEPAPEWKTYNAPSTHTESAVNADTSAYTVPQTENSVNRGQSGYHTTGAAYSNNNGYTASPYTVPGAGYSASARETIYATDNKKKKEKKQKSGRGLGAAALLVAVCVLFSGGAAFAGTYIANSVTASNGSKNGAVNGGTPSVMLQSFENPNKTRGTYEQVAAAVAPTVVEITTESIVTDSVFWGGNYVTSGAGSGVIISANGLIVTNNHVVSGANTINVTLTDGTEYTAELIGTDSESDIAVIKVEAEDLPFALMGNSDELMVGEEVLAVGNPLGELGGTVTNGIVSALARDITIDGTAMTLIQTNAAVNPGNSGGGLFNMYGELIGIVNAKSTSTSSGTSIEGIGYAIPINAASNVAKELVNYGYVRGRVMLGITYIDITTPYEAAYYRVSALGAYITSSKYTDELKVGDRIVAVDGTEITYGSDIKPILKEHSVGDVITITVVREGKYVDIQVTLHEYVPDDAKTTEEDPASFENNFGK